MKKILGLALLLVTFGALSALAADSTPVKVSLFPKLAYPDATTVHGLNLDLIAGANEEVQGVSLGFIYDEVSDKMVGLQSAFVTEAGSVTGVQWGFYNGALSVTGLQFGFINVAEKMKGVQVGLVNVIKTGPVPAMVLVNANF